MMKPIVLILMLILISRVASAQDELEHLSPYATGAGRTYAISARGLDAVGLNPSLLALGTPQPFEITIAPISSLGINAGPSLKQINSISNGFQDTALSSQAPSTNGLTKGDSTRESIANLIGGNNLSSTLAVRVFGMSYFNPDVGGFALTWTMHAAIEASVPDALLNYIGVNALSKIIQGNQLVPQQVNVQALWYSEYTLSYARTVIGVPSSSDLQLLGGVGFKYITGIAAMEMSPGEFSINYPQSTLSTSQYRVGADYLIRSAYPNEFNFNSLPSSFSLNLLANAAAGSGVGADIGITLGIFDSLHNSPWELAVSVSDIGSIQWNKNVSLRSVNTVLNQSTTADAGNKDTLNNQLKALGGTLDTNAGSFTTPLPTTLHIAGAMDFSEIGLTFDGVKLGMAAEYALGLINTVGAPTNGRFGFAITMEHPSAAFSLHTAIGMTTQDGMTDLTFAIGFGIANSILIDAGTDGLNGLFANNGRTDAVVGLKILF